jgi:ATP-dependent Clp protease adaptor protein ClpS
MAIELLEEAQVKVARYPQFKVIMHNDDKTLMDLVVKILKEIFKMEHLRAHEVMLRIHFLGQEIVGIYPLEQAELKVDQTHSMARTAGFPLTCTIEEA